MHQAQVWRSAINNFTRRKKNSRSSNRCFPSCHRSKSTSPMTDGPVFRSVRALRPFWTDSHRQWCQKLCEKMKLAAQNQDVTKCGNIEEACRRVLKLSGTALSKVQQEV